MKSVKSMPWQWSQFKSTTSPCPKIPLAAIFIILRNSSSKRQRPNCILASINQTSNANHRWHNPPISMFGSHGKFVHLNSTPMESDGNLFESFYWRISKNKYHNGVRTVNWTKTPIHFPEVELIFTAMFGKLKEAKMQFGVLALEGKISKIMKITVRFL